MIKYKRIYPLHKNDRFAAVATVQGSDSAGEITIKFKTKPEEDGLCFVLFNPRTYDYELIPLQNRMYINRPVTELTGCAIISKNGMLIDILMAGSVDNSKINISKLKSVIAMDLYSSRPYEGEKPEQNGNEELMDYLQEMDNTAQTSILPEEKSFDDKSVSYNEKVKTDEIGVAQAEAELAITQTSPYMQEIASVINASTRADSSAYTAVMNPFKKRWTGLWWRVQYPDKSWHYIVGRVCVDGDNLSILGIPGERNNKPACLSDCDMYEVAEDGTGYWLVFEK